ncbi:hypothetical protein EMIT0P176_380028 [Pseudomonas sp. IT-P176]
MAVCTVVSLGVRDAFMLVSGTYSYAGSQGEQAALR